MKQLPKPGPDNHHQTFVKTSSLRAWHQHRAQADTSEGKGEGNTGAPYNPHRPEPRRPLLPGQRREPHKHSQLCCRGSAEQAGQEPARLRWAPGHRAAAPALPSTADTAGRRGAAARPRAGRGSLPGLAAGLASLAALCRPGRSPRTEPRGGDSAGPGWGTAGGTRGRAGPRRTHHRRRRRHLGSTCRR